MQTPKASIKSSSGSEGARRVSPRSVSVDTAHKSSSRVVRQLKTNSQETNSSPRTRSPKISDRASPRGPIATEKKRVGRVAELETQVSQLEDALRTVKDQLIVSESWKKQAKLDAEESRNELIALTLRLEESQNLLARFSSNEEQDLNNDEAWNSTHSSALTTALLEIDQLKVKLDATIESEAKQTKEAESAYAEILKLKENLSETHLLMEEMKNQLENSKCSEAHAQALASETLLQLETAKKTMESLKLNSDEHNTIVLELDHSRARIRLLEDIIEKMKTTNLENKVEKESKQVINGLQSKLTSLETELHEKSDENEKLKHQIKKMNDLVEESKQDSNILNSGLANVETELREKSDENKTLKLEIKKMNQDFNNLKSNITSLETEVCNKSEENEKLKLEITKADSVVEEVKASKCEVEDELKRLKVQMSQWRKAAEAATAMLCDENNDNNGQMLADRTWSMGHFSPKKRMNTGSPSSVDTEDETNDNDDDELIKRKNGNVLKRIGVLWKKPQTK